MSSKKPNRCHGTTKAGHECVYGARYPHDAPKWCGNCDPSEASVQRRASAGATRHRRFARAETVDQTDDKLIVKPQDPTIDYIVDLALAAALRVSTGTLTGEQGRAMKLLYQVAIEGLKARGHVGDARGVGTAAASKSSPSDDKPTPAVPANPLDELGRQLDA